MANPFVRAWRALRARFGAVVDEYADPKVVMQQAVEDAQRRHQALAQSAASVIQQMRSVEMKLARTRGEAEKLGESVRMAHQLATEAREKGDLGKVRQFEEAARSFASQLATVEPTVAQQTASLQRATELAAKAKRMVEANAVVLNQKLAERTELHDALEAARLQTQAEKALRSMTEMVGATEPHSADMSRAWIARQYDIALNGAASRRIGQIRTRIIAHRLGEKHHC